MKGKFLTFCGIMMVYSLFAIDQNQQYANKTKYRIDVKNGTARIMSADTVLAPAMLFVNLHDRPLPKNTALMANEIADAAKRGVNIITFTVGFPWPRDNGKPDYQTEVDRWIDTVLEVNPHALLVPRILTTSVPHWWQTAYPDEMTQISTGKKSNYPSIHSRRWRLEATTKLKALVNHLEAKYGPNILGYHVTGHNTGEWFAEKVHSGQLISLEPCTIPAFRNFLTRKYGTDAALASAWGSPDAALAQALPPTPEERLKKSPPAFRELPAERRVVDFAEFNNEEMADAMLTMCAAVKTVAPDKLVFTFYGYHMELTVGAGLQESGHLALEKVMKSPAVDVLCAPVSYMDRYGGGTGPFMTPTDSAALHGKLRLQEDDLRTHLSPVNSFEIKANGHRSAVDVHETQGILTRNAGMNITHGSAVWWMDLWGEGWYRGDEMWDFLAKLRDAQRKALDIPSPAPEIAVFLDGQSHYFLRAFPKSSLLQLYKFRQDLFKIGAPVGFYVLDDLIDGKVQPARLNLFPDAYALDSKRLSALKTIAARDRNTFLWFWSPGIERDGRINPAYVSECSGITLTPMDGQGSGKVKFAAGNGEVYDAGHGCLQPSFRVTDKEAETLAEYTDGSGIAVAAKKIGSAKFIYSGILRLPPWFLRQIAAAAGVHIYNAQDDVATAGHGYVMLHAAGNGEKIIAMPQKCRLKDALSGQLYGPAETFKFKMIKGDSKLFEVLLPQK